MPTIRITKDGSYDPANYLSGNLNELIAYSQGDSFRVGQQGVGFFIQDVSNGGSSAPIQSDSASGNQYAINFKDGIYLDFSDQTGRLVFYGGGLGDVFIGGSARDEFFGDYGDDVLSGSGGNDALEGFVGADKLDGGTGIDTASYALSSSGVAVSLSDPTQNTGDALGDTFVSIENLTGSGLDDVLTGDTGDNVLTGGNGDDTLFGLDGNDTLVISLARDGNDSADGGDGSDTVQFDLYGDAGFLLSGNATGGYVQESGPIIANFTSIENYAVTMVAGSELYVGTVGATVLVDGGAAGVLVDASPADAQTTIVFTGHDGQDRYVAGAGYDHIVFADGGDVVVNFSGADQSVDDVTYASGTALDESGTLDRYINARLIEQVDTGSGSDTILAGASGLIANTGAGGDTFYAGAGTDTFDGGVGFDTISYAHATSGVTINRGTLSGDDGAGDTFTNVERIIGSTFADAIGGTNGRDIIFGGGGSDMIYASGGADTIVLTSDVALIYGGAGNNTLTVASGASVHLTAEVHEIQHLAVRGGGTLDLTDFGGVVSPIRITPSTNPTAAVTAVTGTQWGDTIIGGAGVDHIDGGAGLDIVSGNGGADVFVFDTTGDFAIGRPDRILDFSGRDGEGDRIDVAALGIAGLHDGAFVADGSAQARVTAGTNGFSTIAFDFDGDGSRDASLRVKSDAPLTADDFLFADSPAPMVFEPAAPHDRSEHLSFVGLGHPGGAIDALAMQLV